MENFVFAAYIVFFGASRGTTSAVLTQFTLNGPVPFTSTNVAVFLSAEWRIFFDAVSPLASFFEFRRLRI